MLRKDKTREDSEDILSEVLAEESFAIKDKDDAEYHNRWSHYWYKLFQNAGVERYYKQENKAGIEVAGGLLIIAVLAGIFTRMWFAAIGIPIVAAVILALFLKRTADHIVNKINSQISGFLFALKANLQANLTPEASLIRLADDMPSPLQEDLLLAKNALLAGSSMIEAMELLASKTKSRELEDMARYIIISSRNGSPLENVIDTIQTVIRRKQEVNDQKKRAVAAARPSYIAAILMVPAVFIYMYVSDRAAQDFWFKDILSWVIFGVVVILYVASIFLTHRAVRSLEDKQR